ncbi:hypothetical protein WDV85_04540 [Pseudokineococcus sp. 5B2Z-1]|uniref:hypothetical protein n=1 Tax=Pseudokineococcus sp. 5B2Z-1 TaxID=3132744 RepID=UPI0030AA9F03
MSRAPLLLVALPSLALVGACSTAPPTAEELVPVLAEPRTEADALPQIEGSDVDDGLVAASARRLGATDQAEYWVAVDDEDGVCLPQSLAPGGTNVTRACGSVVDLARYGTWVRGANQTVSATGLLAPEGFDLDDALRDEDWVLIADNLAVPADEAG